MKKILIMFALIVSAVSLTKAQGGGGGGRGGTPEERAAATMAGATVTSLALTDDQKAKILPIIVAYNKAQTEAMAAGGDMQAAMATMRTKAAESEKQIVDLLTADQKKTYEAALATAKQNNPNAATVIVGGRGGRGGGGGGAPGGGGR
jgi:protein CpxP